MAKSSAIEKSELNKIIESYFNLKQYDKAIPYHNTKEKKEDGIILILSIRLCSLQAKDFESAISIQ
jgi:hypothetical protein